MAVPPFVAGAVLTAAQLNGILALGITKKVTATGNVTSSDLPAGQAIIMIGWSGGGGSGGTGATTTGTNSALPGGGGSGAFGITVLPYASAVFPLAVTIGAGGAAGAVTPGSGGSGGNTTVIGNNGAGTTHLSLTGGGGSAAATAGTGLGAVATGGPAGTVVTATFGIAGQVGGTSSRISTTSGVGGNGGLAPMSTFIQGAACANNNVTAAASNAPGQGAGGNAVSGTTSAQVGVAGFRGEVWFIVV